MNLPSDKLLAAADDLAKDIYCEWLATAQRGPETPEQNLAAVNAVSERATKACQELGCADDAALLTNIVQVKLRWLLQMNFLDGNSTVH